MNIVTSEFLRKLRGAIDPASMTITNLARDDDGACDTVERMHERS